MIDSDLPSEAADVVELALSLLKVGDLEQAATVCAAGIQRFPENGQVWYVLAMIMSETGSSDVAIGLLHSALEREPENASFIAELGLAYSRHGDFPMAKVKIQEALSHCPDSPELIRYLVEISSNASAFLRALESAQEKRQAWRLSDAIEELQYALSFVQNSPQVLGLLAATLYEKCMFSDALGLYERLGAVEGMSADARLGQLMALRSLGRFSEVATLEAELGEAEVARAYPLRAHAAASSQYLPRELNMFDEEGAEDFLVRQEISRLRVNAIILPQPEVQVQDADALRLAIEQLPNALQALPKALLYGIQDDWYHQAELFYEWLQDDDNTTLPVLITDSPEALSLQISVAKPWEGGRKAKLVALTELLVRVSDTALCEGVTIALCKYYGKHNQLPIAKCILENALRVFPASAPMKQAAHVIKLKSEGFDIPPYLEKFVGDDTGFLNSKICSLPFEFFDVTETGDVLLCCGHWVPKVVGNFFDQEPREIFNSPAAIEIRKSVVDGSFRYCNHVLCNVMKNNNLPDKMGVTSEQVDLYKAIHFSEYEVEYPKSVLYGLDRSCNLSCPSCRSEVIVEAGRERIKITEATRRSIGPMLGKAQKLFLNPGGELFASRPSRELLASLNSHDFPHLTVDIISNGMLFSEGEWNKFPGVHNMVGMVRISMDAACKETFEKLRRGGKWERVYENLKFLSRLRKEGRIKQLWMSFTYQLDNFREMPAFVDMAESLGFDFALFERLVDIVYGDETFARLAVHSPSHPLFAEFCEVLRHPSMRKKVVFGDFDKLD